MRSRKFGTLTRISCDFGSKIGCVDDSFLCSIDIFLDIGPCVKRSWIRFRIFLRFWFSG